MGFMPGWIPGFNGNKPSPPNSGRVYPNTKNAPVLKRTGGGDSETKYIMVIGETGSGKSTFINMITNYFLNGTVDQLKIAIPTKFHKVTEHFANTERSVKDSAQSQTNSCTPYKFSKDGFKYVVIDSPGLGDTRGIDQDDINIELILKACEDAPSIAAIVIVINGSQARLSLVIKNTLVRIKGSVPNTVLSNIFVVFTNCTASGRNFPLSSFDGFINPTCFHMQNSAFSTDKKKWTKRERENIKNYWLDAIDEIHRLLNCVNEKALAATQAFAEMRSLRNLIKSKLHAAQKKITHLQQLQDSLVEAKGKLGKHGADVDRFSEYVEDQELTRVVFEETPYYNTLCQNCSCVCHRQCGLQETSTVGDPIFGGCACMGSDLKCTVCKEKCSPTFHYHARKVPSEVKETMKKILEDVKKKHDDAIDGAKKAEVDVSNVVGALSAIDQEIKDEQDALIDICKKLKAICSNFNLVDEIHIVIEQLNKEARMLTSTEARNTAESFIRAIKQLCNDLTQNGSSLRASQPSTVVVEEYETSDAEHGETLHELHEDSTHVKSLHEELQDETRNMMGVSTVTSYEPINWTVVALVCVIAILIMTMLRSS